MKKSVCFAALAFVSFSANALTCVTVGTGGGVAFNMAVASNFKDSAIVLATAYANSQSYQITVCEDSSGNLYNAIVPNNDPKYAVFLSADTTRPANLWANFKGIALAAPFTYANGTPVFLISPKAYTAASGSSYPAVNFLVTNQTTGAMAQRSDASLPAIINNVTVNTTGTYAVTNLAIGNPSLAPYGEKTETILTATGQWDSNDIYNAGTNTAVECATIGSGAWMCEYDNINYTLDAINNNQVTAGFVSYGQVCPALTGTKYPVGQYVLFPAYFTQQDGILLNVSDTTAQAKAANFVTWMLGGAGSTNWNTWLTDHCYQAI